MCREQQKACSDKHREGVHRAILQKEELPASVMTPLRNTGSEEAEGTTLSQQMCVGYAGRGISAGVLRVPNSCMALARCPHSLPLSTALLSLAPSLCSPSRPSSSVTPSSLKPSLTYMARCAHPLQNRNIFFLHLPLLIIFISFFSISTL